MQELKVKRLTSFIEKAIGLVGKQKAYPIVIRTRFGIHTFGMRFPIDVLILSQEHIVVKLFKGLAPNRIVIWSLRYDTVIELPHGEIARKSIREGDRLALTFVG